MATIQIRDVPDDVHRVYRRRAAAAGMSLQEFLRDELTRRAATKTPAELMDEVESRLRDTEGEGFSSVSSAEVIREDRETH